MATIVGIDEVGRGCWAGPVFAAAVILKTPIAGLKDSKLLSKNQREKLFLEIEDKANAFGVGMAEVSVINELGLTAAIALAMSKALDSIDLPYDEVIIDGNYNFLNDNAKVRTVIKADNLFQEVSAASVLAKVTRDRWMTDVSNEYPNYGFEKHVGYGTKLHVAMLEKYGICELHRLSYKPIKAFIKG
jgi:ribonuclease HII